MRNLLTVVLAGALLAACGDDGSNKADAGGAGADASQGIDAMQADGSQAADASQADASQAPDADTTDATPPGVDAADVFESCGTPTGQAQVLIAAGGTLVVHCPDGQPSQIIAGTG